MSTPVLPVSLAAESPGIVPSAPVSIPTPISGPARDPENAAYRRRQKKKRQHAATSGDKGSRAPGDPKGKTINLLA